MFLFRMWISVFKKDSNVWLGEAELGVPLWFLSKLYGWHQRNAAFSFFLSTSVKQTHLDSLNSNRTKSIKPSLTLFSLIRVVIPVSHCFSILAPLHALKAVTHLWNIVSGIPSPWQHLHFYGFALFLNWTGKVFNWSNRVFSELVFFCFPFHSLMLFPISVCY